MKVVCIIQARMGSTRLPGKVMLDLCGKTVLGHVIERVRKVKNIDEIVIATTTKEDDTIIVEEALKYGVKVFRGSEEDVLSRYYYAAKENEADVVVRITSDCPLIDPEIVDEMLKKFKYLYKENKVDYLSNTLERTFPRGLDAEIFSFNILEEAFTSAKKHYQREHVTPYIYENPNKFKLIGYKNKVDYSYHRWTLDTEEDFRLISKIYEELYKNEYIFSFSKVINLFNINPKLYNINVDIEQKYL